MPRIVRNTRSNDLSSLNTKLRLEVGRLYALVPLTYFWKSLLPNSACVQSRRSPLTKTTAAAGAAGRRRRPLCDLGTGNFTRPPLPFTTRFGYLNARHGSETSTPAARRFVRLWTPVSDTTCVGTVRIPDTNARHSAAHVRLQAAPAHRSRLTCMPCGEFVRDGLVTTLARCPAAHRSLD